VTAGVYDAARGGAPLREVTTRVPANGAIGAPSTRWPIRCWARSWRGSGVRRRADAFAPCPACLRAGRTGDSGVGPGPLRAGVPGGDRRRFRLRARVPGLGQALLWTADSTPDGRAIVRDRPSHGGAARQTRACGSRPAVAQQAMFERRWLDAAASGTARSWPSIRRALPLVWVGGVQRGRPSRDPVRARYHAFTFRGSYETAVQAYRRALLLAPAFNLTFGRRAIDRLPHLLFAERWYWREGFVDGSNY